MSRENHQRPRQTCLGTHELTFSCHRRFRFLSAERACQWLAKSIEAARVQHDFDVWAFVFMLERAHLIVRPRRPQYHIAAILSGVKLQVGRRAINYLVAQYWPWLDKPPPPPPSTVDLPFGPGSQIR